MVRRQLPACGDLRARLRLCVRRELHLARRRRRDRHRSGDVHPRRLLRRRRLVVRRSGGGLRPFAVVVEAPKTGGETRTLVASPGGATAAPLPRGVLVDQACVYWIDGGGPYTIRKVAK
jgi:hypothetical protein